MSNNCATMSCEACGGRLKEKANGIYECECCLNTYTFDKAKEYSQLLNEKFDALKLEKLSNLKNRLWRALGEKYISNGEITNICEQIKCIDAYDLYANFFSLACAESANNRAIAAFLNDINAKQKGAAVSKIIEFMLMSPELLEGCSTSVVKLIEGAFPRTSESYQKYYGEYTKQMQKIDEGVFDVTLPRDAFIAYSSKDETKVVELVNYLEKSEGMSCFVSLRNLQHGSGSVENYEKQLETAIDNCKVFVFVSSQNSRSNACDALKREIPYVKAKDISIAGVYAQQSYENIPLKYKKPRVEYVISDYTGEGIAERKTSEFFAGIERVYNKQSVAERIFEETNKKFDFSSEAVTPQQPNVEQPKVEQPKVEQQKSIVKLDSATIEEYYQKGNKYYYGRGIAVDYSEAVKCYKKAAEQGHASAQTNLGLCYENGQGVAQNYAEAVKWYKKAAEQGEKYAQTNFGACYYYGKGVAIDYAEAVKWYKKAVEQGHASAQTWLGVCYENGQGVAQNYAEAVKWYKKAAEQGEKYAQHNLGYCYKNGQGVAQNYTEAVKWYKKAAEQGHASAQNNLGLCYKNGQGVTQDYTEAVKWYKKAAEQGEKYAQHNLGYCYKNGQGVAQNYLEAAKWYKKAAEQGYASAQNNLGLCYKKGQGVTQDYAEAVKWYKKAAEQGEKNAQHNLGYCYETGQGVAQNYLEAVKWYKKAAEQGHSGSQNNLAICYEKGQGVVKSLIEAVKLYKKAAANGDKNAQNSLKRLGY